ncbi:MAG: HD domain-containing protein [Ruminococcus sp.]|nr:HD domain-containing protein [Ruminococcus sp.]
MIDEKLKKQIEFMIELDKMKNLYRQTYVLHEDRKENDAEHSWHIAMMAFLLAEYAKPDTDIFKVMKMLIVHDVVEIDAGDTYCYDYEGYKSKAEREEKAGQRIFGILPDEQKTEFYSLWREFEDGITIEAQFAGLLDRLQPIILIYSKHCISWQEHTVKAEQVKDRTRQFADVSPELYELIDKIVNDATKKGYLGI